MNRWSLEELSLLFSHYPNMPKDYILSLLPHRAWRAITLKAHRLGVKRQVRFYKKRVGKIPDRKKAEVIALYCESQLSSRMVAEATGISRTHVKRILRVAGVLRLPIEGRKLAYELGYIRRPYYERTPEIRAKIRQKLTGHPSPRKGLAMEDEYGAKKADEIKQQISNTLRGKFSTGEITPALARLRYQPEFIQKLLAGLIHRPNKQESKLLSILDTHFPNEWRYVGDGKVILGKFSPDFINCNGKKLIIELFGDYWHGKEDADWYETELGRMMAFAQFGYRTLIVWQHELSNRTSIISKVQKFCHGRSK